LDQPGTDSLALMRFENVDRSQFALEPRIASALRAADGEANHTAAGLLSHHHEGLIWGTNVAGDDIFPISRAGLFFQVVKVLVRDEAAVRTAPGRYMNPCNPRGVVRAGRPHNECHGVFPPPALTWFESADVVRVFRRR